MNVDRTASQKCSCRYVGGTGPTRDSVTRDPTCHVHAQPSSKPHLHDLLTEFGQAYLKLWQEGEEHAARVEAAECAIYAACGRSFETSPARCARFVCVNDGYTNQDCAVCGRPYRSHDLRE